MTTKYAPIVNLALPLCQPTGEEPKQFCASCKGPYHPSTGHVAGPSTVWCGPCTKDFVDWLWRNMKRRWGKMRFYDYAYTPEEAVRRRQEAQQG
jgi:hypothetical protein